MTSHDDRQNTIHGLPASLQPGGKLDQVLERSRSAAGSKQSTRLLHERVSGQVGILRVDWNRSSSGDLPEDSLLRYCIRRSDGQAANKYLEKSAAQVYQRHADDLDVILADFIPDDFRQWAREQLAQRDYSENKNFTAAEDWPVFKQMQEQSGVGGGDGSPTGIRKLDQMLGGLRGITFIGGDKGVGKTSFAVQILLHLLQSTSNFAALFYSLDMVRARIYERLLCCASGIDYRTLKSPKKPEEVVRQIEEANRQIQENIGRRLRVVERDFTYDRNPHDQDAPAVRRGIRDRSVLDDCYKLMDACDAQNVLVVFDLFQKIDPFGDVGEGLVKDQHRLDMLQQVQLQSSCPDRPYGFPILVTSEVRKDAAKKEPHRDDLKGDGRIASDADAILLMWQNQADQIAGADVIPTMLRVDKGREGVIRGDVKLWFDHGCFRFYDTKPSEAASPAKSAGRPMVDPLAE
jgi:hypothetical protein